MPRVQQTKESQILSWFKTAPLAVAVLILGLVKDTVHARQAIGKRLQPKPAAPKPAPVAATPVHAKPAAKAKAAKKRKRVRPSRSKGATVAAAGAGEAQLEDLGNGSEQG